MTPRFPHNVTGGKGDAIQAKHLVRRHVPGHHLHRLLNNTECSRWSCSVNPKSCLMFLLWVEEASEHVESSFRTQQCAVQGRDSRHLLNGKSWQRNGGAVREKPGYTPHCVACTVTLQEACEMRSLVAWVSAQNSKSIWSFGAERKRHRWAQPGQFQSRFIFMQHQIQFGELLFSGLLQKSTPASYVRCIFWMSWAFDHC